MSCSSVLIAREAARQRSWRPRCLRSNVRIDQRHLDQRLRLRVIIDEQDADGRRSCGVVGRRREHGPSLLRSDVMRAFCNPPDADHAPCRERFTIVGGQKSHGTDVFGKRLAVVPRPSHGNEPQKRVIGHAPHFGFRATQTVAPKSISA